MLHTFFEKKIKPLLVYVGTIGAIAASIAYIILMFVMVIGFKSETTLDQSIIFSVVNAVVGFIIMQFLKIQGVDFAKQLPESIEAVDEYNQLKLQLLNNPQDTKYHSMTFFWVKTLITDFLVKILTVIVMTSAIIYIVVEGSNDYNMLLLAVVNLILFACFGLISLAKAYDFYKDMHIPYLRNECGKMRNKLSLLTKDITETITNQSVTLAVSESQGDLTNNNELQIEHIEQNNQ